MLCRKTVWIALVLCTTAFTSNATVPDSIQHRVDSLFRLLPESSGRQRYDVTFGIGYELFDYDNPKALTYMTEAHDLAKVLGDTAIIVRSGRLKGQLLRRVGRLEEGLTVMRSVLGPAERNNLEKEVRYLTNAMAIGYTFTGRYDLALELYFRSLEMRERHGDKFEIIDAVSNIGLLYYKASMYERAIEFFKSAIQLDSLTANFQICRTNLGLAYAHLGQCDKAEALFREVLNDSTRITVGDQERTDIHHGRGYCFLLSNDYLNAQREFSYVVTSTRNRGSLTQLSEGLSLMAEIAIHSGKLPAAVKLAEEADSVAKQAGFLEGIETANSQLVDLYTRLGDHEAASRAKSKVIEVKDIKMNAQVIENMTRISLEYYERRNKETIAKQQELLRLQETTIEQQRLLNIAIAGCSILFLIVIILLYRAYRVRKKYATDLEDKVRERTRELQLYVDECHRDKQQTSTLLSMHTRAIKSCMATLQGLHDIAGSYKIPEPFTGQLLACSKQLRGLADQLSPTPVEIN